MTSVRFLHNRQGFTMVEMLIAIVIMTIGVITTLSMISTAMKANTISNRLSAKTSLAQQVAEEMLSRKIDDPIITTTSPATVYDLDNFLAGNDIVIDGAGTFHATYSTVINTPSANVTQIIITITTVPNDGNPLSITCYKRTI